MIKKQQKWIALLVTLTFIWLLQVTTMPVAAAGTTEKVSSANAEQGPDYLEAIGQKAAPAKKKSILPYVLIGVGVLAVTAVLVLVVFKKTYDITGSWRLTIEYDGHPTGYNFIFSGSKKNGIFNIILPGYVLGSGTYMVDGKDVSIIIDWNGPDIANLTGAFTDADHMEGTYTETPDYSGRWYAERVDSEAAELREQTAGDPHARR